MADPATDVFGSLDVDKIVRGAMPQATVDVPKVRAGLTDVAEKETKAKEPVYDWMSNQLKADVTETHKKYEGIDPLDVKPWDAAAEKKSHTTEPMAQFGSLGFIAAQLASAFTRNPMVNALRGGAAAMEAIQQKDDQGYDRAYAAWKDTTQLAIKRHDIQRQSYDDAIKLMNSDRAAGVSELAALTEKFGDKRSKALLDGDYIKELIDYQNSMSTAYRGMAQMMPQIEQMNAKRKAASFLTDQGKDPMQVYREIYAPAYSQSVGHIKAQMIADVAQKNGGDWPAAVREVESSFKPAEQAAKVGPKYAAEFLEGIEKDGVPLRPETKKLINDTIGTTAKSDKVIQASARVAQAGEEIALRKQGDTPLKPGEADQIIRDAIQFEGGQKIDQAIINQLPQYEGMDRKKLGYIGVKNQERILNSVQSAEQIEHIATYAKDNPEAVGLIADAAREINVDAYKGLIAKPSDYITKLTNDRDAAIDVAAREKGLAPDMAAKAKVLNKMLATQAFADAAQAGSRGATIYLDKAFREIYQQASSLPTFFDILHIRQRDADMNLEKYNLGLDRRKDVDTQFGFWKAPGKYLEAAVAPRGEPQKLPPKSELKVGTTYKTKDGPLVWGGDVFFSPEEWQARSAR